MHSIRNSGISARIDSSNEMECVVQKECGVMVWRIVTITLIVRRARTGLVRIAEDSADNLRVRVSG